MTSTSILSRVEHACAQLRRDGHPVTFTAIAGRTGLSRTTLYRNPACAPPSTATGTTPQPAAPSPASPASPARSRPSTPPSTPSPPASAATKNNSASSRPVHAESVNRPTPETEVISRISPDNAVIESWHSTLEFELRRVEQFTTKTTARSRVAAWIDDYNRQRRHSALGMRSPMEYEQMLQPKAA
jgi:hypothetical protein